MRNGACSISLPAGRGIVLNFDLGLLHGAGICFERLSGR